MHAGNCISTVLSEDMCNLTSYSVDCKAQTSTSCRCRNPEQSSPTLQSRKYPYKRKNLNNNYILTTTAATANVSCAQGSIYVATESGCYPPQLPCYNVDGCADNIAKFDCTGSDCASCVEIACTLYLHNIAEFLLFGEEVGDAAIPTGDDRATELIDMDVPVMYFGEQQNAFSVNSTINT